MALIQQLLAFSREQTHRPTVLDLNAVIQRAMGMITPLIGEDIKVVLDLDPALDRVRADEGQVEQVLLNIVVNSREAMPDGGTLTIKTANTSVGEDTRRYPGSKPGAYVTFAVTDTGIGMDEKTTERMFEPFFTTKESGKGTGLGLATTYGIVRQSGGFISVKSELRRGTTLEIGMPTVVEQADPLPAPKQLAAPTGRGTVLVVEDTAPLRHIAREFLEGVGYNVLEADGGQAALEIAAKYKGPISVMITDVVMPGMSGCSLAERIRSERPETKVLYVSGYNDKAVSRTGLQETALLHKPYTQYELTSKVRDVQETCQ